MELIVLLSLRLAATWQVRFLDPCAEFPLLLLVMVEQPADEDCPRRRAVADMWRSTPDCCLRSKHADVAVKLRILYRADIDEAAQSGTCPKPLMFALLAVRAVLVGQTQDLERMNNMLVRMAERAPHMGLALASARMSMKKGRSVEAHACAAIVPAIREFMATYEHAQRFCPHVPDIAPPRVAHSLHCPHTFNAATVDGAALAYACKRVITTQAGHAYRFVGDSSQCVFPVMRHGFSLFCAMGARRVVAETPMFFSLSLPIRVEPLRRLIATHLGQARGADDPPLAELTLSLEQVRLQWVSLNKAFAPDDTITTISVTRPLVRRKRNAAPKRDAAPAAGAIGDENNGDDAPPGEDILAAMLEEEELDADVGELFGDGAAEFDPEQDILDGEAVHVDGDLVDPDPDDERAAAVVNSTALLLDDGIATTVHTHARDAVLARLATMQAAEVERARARRPDGLLRRLQISLIQHEGVVFFVEWTEPITHCGRRCRLDEQSRFKGFIPYMHRPESII